MVPSESGSTTYPVMVKLPSLARVTVVPARVYIEGPAGRYDGAVTIDVANITMVSREDCTVRFRVRQQRQPTTVTLDDAVRIVDAYNIEVTMSSPDDAERIVDATRSAPAVLQQQQDEEQERQRRISSPTHYGKFKLADGTVIDITATEIWIAPPSSLTTWTLINTWIGINDIVNVDLNDTQVRVRERRQNAQTWLGAVSPNDAIQIVEAIQRARQENEKLGRPDSRRSKRGAYHPVSKSRRIRGALPVGLGLTAIAIVLGMVGDERAQYVMPLGLLILMVAVFLDVDRDMGGGDYSGGAGTLGH